MFDNLIVYHYLGYVSTLEMENMHRERERERKQFRQYQLFLIIKRLFSMIR